MLLSISIINVSRDIVLSYLLIQINACVPYSNGKNCKCIKVDCEVSSYTRAKGSEMIKKIMKLRNKDWFFRENGFWPTWEN